MSATHPTVGIVGVGTMGGIILDGLVRAGWPTDSIVVSGRTPAKVTAAAPIHDSVMPT